MTLRPREEFDEDDSFGEFLGEEDQKEEMKWYAKHEASQILDFDGQRLYLGNIYQTMELTYNDNPLGIKAVLDVSTESDYEKNPKIVYLRIPFPDGHEIPQLKFAQCMAFLSFCWAKKLTVLVNCAAGMSRSVCVVTSWLYYSGIGRSFTPPIEDFDKLLGYVEVCRPIIQPSATVVKSCKKWLREGGFGYTPPKARLESAVNAVLLKLHTHPECEVKKAILANSDTERHRLNCPCSPAGNLA